MITAADLELGHLVYGPLPQEYACPEWIINLLWGLAEKLPGEWRWGTPFDNSGESFRNEVFAVQAYSWGDEDQPWNFKYDDIEISWYKWLGRGTTINRIITGPEGTAMYIACLNSLDDIRFEEDA
jgi:hypothetical protein